MPLLAKSHTVTGINSQRRSVQQAWSYLKGIAWGDSGEALAVMGSRPQASHAKVSVVDGEDDLGPPEAIGLVVLPEGLGNACSAPVMAVQNVWLAACLQQELQCCLQAQGCRQVPNQPSAWEKPVT